ncbi:DinB family protein [Algibacter marinivivus]|uniref:DinB family protein n=1 Tax=Algibacter marinivivus TaxID=2100723 RepID=A0A2U2X563_9FLAO|nr:DinB family protein [Algibacter marinivivus]PWH82892.1 DinB family protein [Algibacter marinivivus]
MRVTDLNTSEYNSYYGTYTSKVPKDVTLMDGFVKAEKDVVDFFKSIPEGKLEYRYASGKWSIKEVLQHIIDTERVFMYRCFRIARHDSAPLVGYEQDDYIEPSKADDKSINDLLEEYKIGRKSFIILLKSINDADLMFTGHASGSPLSARAAAFIILGHEIHHMEVIKTLYL